MKPEVYNCAHGKPSVITREIWCERFREFCRYVDHCEIRYSPALSKVEQRADNSAILEIALALSEHLGMIHQHCTKQSTELKVKLDAVIARLQQ